MRRKAGTDKPTADRVVKDIRRKTRKHHSAEEKIRIVLEGLRGEESIAALCRREGIATSLYYSWSKEFLEAGKKRLAGDTVIAVSIGGVVPLLLKRLNQDPVAASGPLLTTIIDMAGVFLVLSLATMMMPLLL